MREPKKVADHRHRQLCKNYRRVYYYQYYIVVQYSSTSRRRDIQLNV